MPLRCVNPLQIYSVINNGTSLNVQTGGAINISGPLVAVSYTTSNPASMVVASVSNNGAVAGMAVNSSVADTMTVQHGDAYFAGTAPGVTVSSGTKHENDPTIPNLLIDTLGPEIQTLADQLASLPGVPVNTLTGGQILFNGAAYTNTAVFVTDLTFLNQNVPCNITAPTGSPRAVIINVLVTTISGSVRCSMNNGPLIQAITIWNFLVDSSLVTAIDITLGAIVASVPHHFEGSILWARPQSDQDVLTVGNVSGSIGTTAALGLAGAQIVGAVVTFPTSTVCVE
jgi:hypothetical protein